MADTSKSMNVTTEIPSGRLIEKLGLKKFDKHADFEEHVISQKLVYIPLGAHIGKKAVPVVSIGDFVKAKEKIAVGEADSISANMHSSISGVVKSITETEIIIEGR